MHRCRGSSPVERGPEKAGVASPILALGTIPTSQRISLTHRNQSPLYLIVPPCPGSNSISLTYFAGRIRIAIPLSRAESSARRSPSSAATGFRRSRICVWTELFPRPRALAANVLISASRPVIAWRSDGESIPPATTPERFFNSASRPLFAAALLRDGHRFR
jgi:hypothetical protein